MCILFIHTGGPSAGGYKLILASNRDEYFKRPAKPAEIWKNNKNVIGGQDMEPGREGGTWLALNGQGKRIGVLLNLPNVPTTPTAQGRGSIVSDFVSGDMKIDEYIKQLENNSNGYNPFSLVTAHIGDTSEITFYSNFDKIKRTYSEGVIGFSNSLPETPLKKTVFGIKQFDEIITNNISNSNKDDLINKLHSFLQCDQKHLPDPELAKRSIPSDDLASIFVHIPQFHYGTRTHTIILVDADGIIDFYEWTKIPEQTDWLKTHIQEKLPI